MPYPRTTLTLKSPVFSTPQSRTQIGSCRRNLAISASGHRLGLRSRHPQKIGNADPLPTLFNRRHVSDQVNESAAPAAPLRSSEALRTHASAKARAGFRRAGLSQPSALRLSVHLRQNSRSGGVFLGTVTIGRPVRQ